MPRSYQAFTQNASVTHSPASVGNGDPTQAIDDGSSAFAMPKTLDICAPITSGTANPFMSGLNTMGEGTGTTTNVPGQSGNVLSGLQQFADSLCGFALGGTTTSEVLTAARHLRASGGDLHETLEAVRRLRDTVGAGTTPQSVLAAVEGVNGVVHANPVASGVIADGKAAVGPSGNQTIDGINGAQHYAGLAHLLLAGKAKTNASGSDLFTAGTTSVTTNTAKHVGHQSVTTAQSVNVTDQNLLVSQNFSTSYSVSPDPTGHWSWDGTHGDPATNVLGCLSCSCDGTQPDYLSNEIPVVAGENVEISATVKWDGLTYAGSSPIVLGVEKYRQMLAPDGSGSHTYADIGGFDAATLASPGASSSGAFVGVAGVYLVEPGVDQIRMRFKVAKNATGGTVRWDNGEFLKTDLIADAAVPGVGTTTDNIVNKLYGTAGSGFTHNDAAVALANTASALASVTSKAASLAAEGHTGAVAGDDFNYSGELTASGLWGGGYSTTQFGTYQANGTDAEFVTASVFSTGTVDCHFDWLGTGATSTTDYQLIQTVLKSPPGLLSNFPTKPAYLYVLGRISSDFQNYIKIKIGGDGSYTVIRCVGGVEAIMNSGTCSVPGGGTIVSLYCGDKPSSTLRMFTAQIGSLTIAQFTESGTTSQVGSLYRGWGWGGTYTKLGLGASHVSPPNVDQWLAVDQ